MLGTFLRTFVDVLYPLGALFAVLLVLFLLACWKRKFKQALVLGPICLAFYLIGSTPVPEYFLKTLERPYYDTDHSALPVCDAIVLLGGGGGGSPSDIFQFNAGLSFDRALTAIELSRQKKAPVLVVGGSQFKVNDQFPTEGQLLERMIDRWKLLPIPIITLKASVTTRDEARQTRDLAEKHGWKRVLLVTSALHMRRAEAIFNAAGVKTVPAACNFRSDKSSYRLHWNFRFPSSGGFLEMEQYLHEIVGWYAFQWFGGT